MLTELLSAPNGQPVDFLAIKGFSLLEPLLTRDADFKHYAKHGGLKLAKQRGK